MHVIMNIENNGHGESLHRFDQYMNPYYVADKAAGRITEDEAIELIQCFFIKMTDVMKLRAIPCGRTSSSVARPQTARMPRTRRPSCA